MARRKRSILKAITFRIIATITTILLVLLFTGNWALANTVGALDLVSKLGLYYVHERLWLRVPWGKGGSKG